MVLVEGELGEIPGEGGLCVSMIRSLNTRASIKQAQQMTSTAEEVDLGGGGEDTQPVPHEGTMG